MAILTSKQTWKRDPSKQRMAKNPIFSAAQQESVRRAIGHLWYRLGSPEKLAAAMGVSMAVLRKLRNPSRPPSPRLVFVIARVAEATVDDIVSGTWPPDGSCPYCGRS